MREEFPEPVPDNDNNESPIGKEKLRALISSRIGTFRNSVRESKLPLDTIAETLNAIHDIQELFLKEEISGKVAIERVQDIAHTHGLDF